MAERAESRLTLHVAGELVLGKVEIPPLAVAHAAYMEIVVHIVPTETDKSSENHPQEAYA